MNSSFFGFGKICPLLLLLCTLNCLNTQQVFAQPQGFSDELVMDGWSQAVGITFDKNGQMYVWEKGGKVWTVIDGIKSSEPLIDISEEVGNWRDFGLVGFALDPNFLNNGHIYLWYVVDRHHLFNFGTSNYNPIASSEKEATIARLTRYTASAASNFAKVNYASRKVLIGKNKSTGPAILHESHGAGQIVFGTDGTLMVTVGDGATYTNPVDEGSHPDTYFQQALADGIITSSQNIGAYRCQSLNNLSGKILRIDPSTGDGIPSNPYYHSSNPSAPQSRIWSLGVRNPYRITLKPGTGSHNAKDGNPGTFYFGDVGWSTWEDLNVIEKAGQNFGWPIYEGINMETGYKHPNYAVSSANHVRPKVDWRHNADQARAYLNNAMTNIGSGPVAGQQFRGNSSTGGVWYTGNDFPEAYQNTYFHADYSGGWIRNFGFDQNNNPTYIKDFKLNAGAVVFLNTSPTENGLFYVRYPNQIRKIIYTGTANKKPIANIAADKTYGASPLTIQFDASASFDPEYSSLSYQWDFGNNQTSTTVNPTITFTAPSTNPSTFSVKLKVTDEEGASNEKTIPVSLNNTPPIIISTSLDNINYFSANNGATLNLNAVVTDKEHNGQLRYEWQTALFHNGHSHAEPIDNNPSTSASLSAIDCDGSSYWFRITLTVTDPEGLSSIFQKDIFPDCNGLVQTINWSPIPDHSINAGDIIINATATSGLPVNIYLLEGPATIFGNKIVPTGFPGKVKIRAVQGGNNTYKPATPIERSFNIVLPTNTSCTADGWISRDIWNGGGRGAIDDIPLNNTSSQNSNLYKFEASPWRSADDAERIRGFLCPPETGLYTFWLAGDEDSELWLSTTPNPEDKRLIANVDGHTRPNQWNKYATQQSEPILLVAGNPYYIESIMNGGGHLSVGWKKPDNTLDRPISGQYLSPWKGNKQNQQVNFFGIPDKITTDPAFTINATSSSGLPVSFTLVSGPATVSGTTVTLTGATGTVVIRANQSGNSQYHTAISVDRRFEVTAPPILPGVTITSPSNGSNFSENKVDIRYNLSGNLAFHQADHLLISLDNQPTVDVHSLTGLYTLNNLAEGAHNLKIQIADNNHRPFTNPAATAQLNFTVVFLEKEQQINFNTIPNKLTTDIPFPISASATSGLPVGLRIQSGPATLNGNTVSLDGVPGLVIIRASQNGNEAYLPATDVLQSFMVNAPEIDKLNQTITFDAIPNKSTDAPPFEVVAKASSELPVSLVVESGPAYINDNRVTLTGNTGTVTIRANQAGNSQFLAAPNVDRSFQVNTPIISTNPGGAAPENYCSLTSDYPWEDWIGKVVFGGLENNSAKDVYKFYDHPTTTVNKGERYALKVIPAFSWTQWDEYIKVWIDYNRDGDFADNGEEIFSGISRGGEALHLVIGVAGNILIPSTAALGKTRMRIAMQRGNFPSPCGKINQGEVEDYMINIVESQIIEKQTQSLNFLIIPDQLTISGSVALFASATSNLPITFSILSGPASINGNLINLNGTEGTVVVKAQQDGNAQFHPAPSINRTFNVLTPPSDNEEEAPESNPNYCTAKGNAPWQEWIGNVSFGTINFNSTKDGYGDYTHLSTTVNQGNSYAISVSPAFSWIQWDEYINVWIDFNQNGDFEDIGEQVLSGISMAGSPQSFPKAVAGTVTIPTNAKMGKTGMRVTMQQGKYAEPCYNFEYGEVEDYTIHITANNSNRAAPILTFSAYPDQSQSVSLEWVSNSDDLADHYQIERSEDNLKFYTIQEKQPLFRNLEANFYFSLDKAPLKGFSYYRVKQINKNGDFKYSNVVEVERAYGTTEFYLYPNPVKDIIHLNLNSYLGKPAHIRIFNTLGQLVKESKFDKLQISTISFDLSNDQNGIYYLQIKSGSVRAAEKSFILNRDY